LLNSSVLHEHCAREDGVSQSRQWRLVRSARLLCGEGEGTRSARREASFRHAQAPTAIFMIGRTTAKVHRRRNLRNALLPALVRLLFRQGLRCLYGNGTYCCRSSLARIWPVMCSGVRSLGRQVASLALEGWSVVTDLNTREKNLSTPFLPYALPGDYMMSFLILSRTQGGI